MTRFDASTPDDRRALVADAVEAHRDRESQFCTVEAAGPPGGAGASAGQSAEQPAEPSGGSDADPELTAATEQPAWVQFSEREGQLNLDCTDAEYDRITDVLSEFPSFTVDAQESPEDADGRNLRIGARADAERIAELVERLFVEGFGYDESFRLWATEI